MGKVKTFEVTLNSQNDLYYPGQMVQGNCRLELKEDLKINKIFIDVKAYAFVRWSESHGSGKNRRTVTYSATEHYINQRIIVLEKEQGKDKLELDDGKYDYPFQFQLPPDCPSSYEARIGHVRYSLRGTVDIPWAFDSHTLKPFTVVNLLDLNTLPASANGAEKYGQKTLCCLCCESDPIECTVKVDRCGYVPGESIPFKAEINNKSNRTMSCTKASLVMSVTYKTPRKSRTVGNVVAELKHGEIDGGGSDHWYGEKLPIPPVPPSYLKGCNIIDIRYYVTMTVDPSGIGFDLHVPVEVIIGSIPLQSVAQQYVAQSVIPPTPAGAPRNIYGDVNVPENVPLPTYAESAMGQVSVKEEGDNDETYGKTEYAPMYTYYNWEKRDPATHFSVVQPGDNIEQ